MATKKYEMGKNVDRHEVPITVQELSHKQNNLGEAFKEAQADEKLLSSNKQIPEENAENLLRSSINRSVTIVPTTVESLVQESIKTLSTNSYKQSTESKTVTKIEEKFSSMTSSLSSSSTLERSKSSATAKPFNIVTSLPPLPRSHSGKKSQQIKTKNHIDAKTDSTGIIGVSDVIDVLDPIDVFCVLKNFFMSSMLNFI